MALPRIYKAEGIVLKRRTIGEADRIITLFTKEYGKIKVIAKGVRRITSRRSGHVEVFSHVTITLHRGKNLDILTEAQALPRFGAIRENLQKVSYSYYLCELVDQLTAERQEHPEVFSMLCASLTILSESQEEPVWQHEVVSFALALLWTLGYLPRAQYLSEDAIAPFIESIIERKLHARWLLTKLGVYV